MKLFTSLTLLTLLVSHVAQSAPAPKPFASKPTSPVERRWVPQFATYLGGSGSDYASAVAVDGIGNFYVVGASNSPSFPGAQTSPDVKRGDAFLCKFSPSYQLLWTRFLGGSGFDNARGVALDQKGDIYIVGHSENGDIPVLNAPQLPHSQSCAFVARYSSEGELKMANLLGGSGWGRGEKIVVDGAGNIWLAGIMRGQFPAKDTQLVGAGKNDVWLSKLSPSGELLFSTLLGGSEDESLGALILALGGVALAGTTASPNFPVMNATQAGFAGASSNMNSGDVNGDAWVCVLDGEGKTRWSTFFGGKGADVGEALAMAPNGDLWLSGSSSSRDLPLKKTLSGGDALGGPFLARFAGDGSQLLQATFIPRAPRNGQLLSLGGSGDLWIGSDADSYVSPSQLIHLDADATKVVEIIPWPTDHIEGWAQSAKGALYLTGTASARVPVRRALMAAPGGGYEAFITVLQLQAPPALDAKPATISVDASTSGLNASGTTNVGEDGEVQIMLYRVADSAYWTGTEWKNAPNWLSARITGTHWELENLPKGANLPAGDYYLHSIAVMGDQFENFLGAEYDLAGRAKTSRKIGISP